MELTVAQVAEQASRTERFVQLALHGGALAGHRRHGRIVTIDDVAARAWSRSLGRGRTWTTRTRSAALDLLSEGQTTEVSGSERSRLRARLRTMSAGQMAHAAGGLGSWARYRGAVTHDMTRLGPSAADTELLGIVAGEDWLTFVQTADLDEWELAHDVVLDADGNLGITERDVVDERVSRILLDTYLLGDARQSAAAAGELERRARNA